MNITKALKISSLMLLFSSTQLYAEEQFRGQYFVQVVFGGDISGSGVGNGVLLDDDLIRGNGSAEAVITVAEAEDPNESSPFQFFNSNTQERLMTIIFNDDTSIEQVQGLYDVALFNFSVANVYYLPDPTVLAAVGKTLDDISDIVIGEIIDHDLNWSDLGFSLVDVPEVPVPTIEPEFNHIVGDGGNNRLVGTEGGDIIDGESGARDLLTGGRSNDFFVVGADVGNGVRNIDVILDFNVGEDGLMLENGATIRDTRISNGSLVITLNGGDQDIIRLRNVTADIPSISIISFDVLFEDSPAFLSTQPR